MCPLKKSVNTPQFQAEKKKKSKTLIVNCSLKRTKKQLKTNKCRYFYHSCFKLEKHTPVNTPQKLKAKFNEINDEEILFLFFV